MYLLVFQNSFQSFVIFSEHYFSSLEPCMSLLLRSQDISGIDLQQDNYSIIPSVHFSLPQSLKQNHFAVPSHALSVTFFSLEFIQ